MKYITFYLKAKNKHTRGQAIDRPIMFELHDETENSVTFRFRDVKLKHCTCSLKVNNLFSVTNEDGGLDPMSVAMFLSAFLSVYYANAAYIRTNKIKKITDAIPESSKPEDFNSFFELYKEMEDNSISPTLVYGIIEALENFNPNLIETETGEKTKSVQKNRRVLEFQFNQVVEPSEQTVNA